MAINFPSAPSVDDTHTENNFSFQWDGTVWNPLVTALSLNESDIPDLSAAKITSGEFDTTRLAAGGTDGQVLTRTASGMDWEDAESGTDLSTASTNDLTEGSTNLYFTNERVDDRLNDLLIAGSNITLTYDDAANTLTIASTATGTDLSTADTDDLSEGSTNLYFTTARADARISSWARANSPSGTIPDSSIPASIARDSEIPSDTDGLSEGSTNFYFTPARADARISTWARANSPSGTIPDARIPASIARDSEIPSDTDALTEGSTNFYFTNTRADNRIASWARANSPSGTIPDSSIPASIARDSEIPSDTDALGEGSSNLYFTNERVDDRINALLTAGANITLTYDDAANTLTIASTATGTDLSTADTDDLSEGGTNLYFTNTRADDRIATWARANSPSGTIPDSSIPASIARDSEIPSNTDGLTEGSTNQYFTNERVDDRVNALLTAGTKITLTYDDAANTLTIAADANADTADALSTARTIELTGDVSGSTAFDGSADVQINTSISVTTETIKILTAGTSVEIASANMAAGASANAAHGLSRIPDYIEFYYECVTANSNWEVGNRIPVKEASRSTVGASATHVYISLPSGGAQVIVADRDGGGQAIITLSEWKAVAIPYIFEDRTVVTGIS